jgi:release factor glutamine methyltransferase
LGNHDDHLANTFAAQLVGLSWRDAISTATAAIQIEQGESAATDARRLLAQTLGCSTLDLVTHPHQPLTPTEAKHFASAVHRRAKGEPVSRISGHRGFYGREFLISPATLDPRPETETLIDAALARINTPSDGFRILDIGTGSGCLLLTLLAEWPHAQGIGVDPSREALAIAAKNADRLGVAGRVDWIEGLIEDVDAHRLGRFPLIVSNPPYIPTATIGTLDRNVRDFDPHLALDGGHDGLDVYRAIALKVNALAAPGWGFLEVGAGQAPDVADIFRRASLAPRITHHEALPDMAGIHRCVALKIL